MLDTSRFDLLKLMTHQSVFAGVDQDVLLRLSQCSQLRRYGRGELVSRQGETCAGLQVVITGTVKLFVVSRAGQEKVVEIVQPGGSFGESFMFQDVACLLSGQATCDALILQVQREAVLQEAELDPSFAMRIVSRLSHRLNQALQHLQSQSLLTAPQRVVGFLLRQHGDPLRLSRGTRVTLPGSKAMIASLLSITPEYFSRVLRHLEQAGLIKVERREITIVDAERLAVCQG
jgi:CRP-like cAMP-binding protein